MFPSFIQHLNSRKGDLWLLSATVAGPVLGVVGGMIAALNLSPEELGVVQAIVLIPTYVHFLQFGVFNGLNRNLPLFRAKNEPEKAQGFVNSSARMARYVALAGALIALVSVCLFLRRSKDPNYAYAALFLLPALFFGPLKLHQNTVYRGMREFERLGKSLHLVNLWTLLCSVSTSVIGITGLVLKLGTQDLLGWVLLSKNPPMKEEGRGSFCEIKQLSTVGMPMLISGLIFTWLSAADRTIVATFLAAEDLGYFALAAIAMNALKAFPDSINQLLYPRLSRAYGAKGSSRQLRRYIWIGLALNLVVMLPVAIIGWFTLSPLVLRFLPEYAPGIQAAQISLVGALTFVYSGPSVLIPILRRNLPSQLVGVVCIGLVWAGGIYAVSAGHGIVGVAIARVAANAIYCVFNICFVFYLTHQDIRPE